MPKMPAACIQAAESPLCAFPDTGEIPFKIIKFSLSSRQLDFNFFPLRVAGCPCLLLQQQGQGNFSRAYWFIH